MIPEDQGQAVGIPKTRCRAYTLYQIEQSLNGARSWGDWKRNLNKSHPFCDGSHVGTSFKPKNFTVSEGGDVFLCMCKYSNDLPYCEGTHQRFDNSQVGKEATEPKSSSANNVAHEAKNTVEEPTLAYTHQLAKEGLSKLGHHGKMTSIWVCLVIPSLIGMICNSW